MHSDPRSRVLVKLCGNLLLTSGLTFLALVAKWTFTFDKIDYGRRDLGPGFPNELSARGSIQQAPTKTSVRPPLKSDKYEPTPEKIILFWTKFFGQSNSYMGKKASVYVRRSARYQTVS